MKYLLLSMALLCTAGQAVAWDGFGDQEVETYCRSTKVDNFYTALCKDEARRHFNAWTKLTEPQSAEVVRIFNPTMRRCRSRFFPDWHSVYICSQGDIAAAMRLAALRGRDANIRDQCLRKYGDRLYLAEACVSRFQ